MDEFGLVQQLAREHLRLAGGDEAQRKARRERIIGWSLALAVSLILWLCFIAAVLWAL